MHTWLIIAFLLFVAAAALSAYQRAWTMVLLAAGLAAWLVPAVFQITSA